MREQCVNKTINRLLINLNFVFLHFCIVRFVFLHFLQVFRRINKALPQLTYLDLESSSPRLLSSHALQLAVPGTYRADQPVIQIMSVVPKVDVIASKQRPRKLTILGSNGQEYQFLLKGKVAPAIVQLFVVSIVY